MDHLETFLAFASTPAGSETLGVIGLQPVLPPHKWDYWCTPEDAVTFATSGGDGVHFSYLRSVESAAISCPVVMSAPFDNENPNLVLGSSLQEFLRLGYRVGFAGVEEILWSGSSFLAGASGSVVFEFDPEEVVALKRFREYFSLAPWVSVAERINQLQELYSGYVRVAKVF